MNSVSYLLLLLLLMGCSTLSLQECYAIQAVRFSTQETRLKAEDIRYSRINNFLSTQLKIFNMSSKNIVKHYKCILMDSNEHIISASIDRVVSFTANSNIFINCQTKNPKVTHIKFLFY